MKTNKIVMRVVKIVLAISVLLLIALGTAYAGIAAFNYGYEMTMESAADNTSDNAEE